MPLVGGQVNSGWSSSVPWVLCGGIAQGRTAFSALLILAVPSLAIKNVNSVKSFVVGYAQTNTIYTHYTLGFADTNLFYFLSEEYDYNVFHVYLICAYVCTHSHTHTFCQLHTVLNNKFQQLQKPMDPPFPGQL